MRRRETFGKPGLAPALSFSMCFLIKRLALRGERSLHREFRSGNLNSLKRTVRILYRRREIYRNKK
jgi:hypothetical protein